MITNGVRIAVSITFAFYSLLTIALGIWATKQAQKGADQTSFGKKFYAGGGNMHWLLVGMLLAGGACSAGTFLSNPGLCYSWGFMWELVMCATVFSVFLGSYSVNKKLKIVCQRINAVSIGVVLKHLYDNNKIIGWCAPLALVVFSGLFLYMQMTSGAVLVQTMTGLDYVYSLIIFSLVLIVYTIYGGVKGSSIVSVFQGIIMSITTVSLAVGLFLYVRGEFGTVENAFRNLGTEAPALLTPANGGGIHILVGYLIFSGVSLVISKDNVSRAVKVGTTKALARSTVLTIVFIGFWSMVMPFLGILGRTVFDVQADTIIPHSALIVLPPYLAGVVVAGVTAAIHSTLSVNLLNINATVVMDIYNSLLKKDMATKEQLQKANTISTVVLVILMTLFAIKPPALIGIINIYSVAGGAAVFFVPLLFGTLWKRANEYGAIASMIAGVAYYIIANNQPALAFNMEPVGPTLVLASIIMVVVSLVTPKPKEEVIKVWFGANYR